MNKDDKRRSLLSFVFYLLAMALLPIGSILWGWQARGSGAQEQSNAAAVNAPLPDGADDSAWAEPKAKDAAIEKARPGNFEAIGVSIEFLAGLHSRRPKLVGAAAPFYWEGEIIDDLSKFEAAIRSQEARARDAGTKAENKFRQYNLDVRELRVFSVSDDTVLDIAAFKEGTEYRRRLEACFKAKGSGLLVQCELDLVSLESGRRDSVQHWLYLTRTGGAWTVCMYQK